MTDKEFEGFNKQLKETPLVKLTQEKLNSIWNSKNKKNGIKYGDEFKYSIGLRLSQYAQGKRYDYLNTKKLFKDDVSRAKIIEAYRKRKGSSSSSLSKQFLRLSIGYRGLTLDLSPFKCGLSSEKANKNYKNKTVGDHVIGATLCSQYVIDVFLGGMKSNEETWTNLEDWLDIRIDFMCNKWLKDNLWLWAQCRITEKEHIPEIGEGVRRAFDEFEGDVKKEVLFKAKLSHYEEADIKYTTYNNITN